MKKKIPKLYRHLFAEACFVLPVSKSKIAVNHYRRLKKAYLKGGLELVNCYLSDFKFCIEGSRLINKNIIENINPTMEIKYNQEQEQRRQHNKNILWIIAITVVSIILIYSKCKN